MGKKAHYSPEIRRFIVKALYYEARERHTNMTELTNRILQDSLARTRGWARALEDPPSEGGPHGHRT